MKSARKDTHREDAKSANYCCPSPASEPAAASPGPTNRSVGLSVPVPALAPLVWKIGLTAEAGGLPSRPFHAVTSVITHLIGRLGISCAARHAAAATRSDGCCSPCGRSGRGRLCFVCPCSLSRRARTTPCVPNAEKPNETRTALPDHQRRIGLCGVAPLINQCGEA